MSRFARRIYYLSAFLVFAIVAPLLLAWTAGYRWSPSTSAVIKTGSLTVTSDPHASISLNGVNRGSTPFRATHLTPGTYQIELTKAGLGTWRQEVAVAANTALTIGPVMLYPESLTVTDLTTDGQPPVASGDRSVVFVVTDSGSTRTAQELWPTTNGSSVTLPWLPTSVIRSRSGQTLLWQNSSHGYVTIKNEPTTPWAIDLLNQPAFDPASEAIFYGLQGTDVIRYDSLTKDRSVLAPGTSYRVVNDTLWLTQSSAATTTVLRRPSFGQHLPDTILTLPGRWVFVDGPPGSLVLHNPATRELATLNQLFGTEQFTTTTLGPADRWWWTEANQPPLWLNGSDLLTLDDKKQPQLLDRLSEVPQLVAWLVPGHVLLTVTDTRLSITSVSSRQGRGTLLEHAFDQPVELLGLNLTTQTVILQTSTMPQQVTELRW